MKVTLSWTAASGVTSQLVQYKLASLSTWTDHGYVNVSSTSAVISDLQDNFIYNFRVLTDCGSGSVATSLQTSQINITCPTITTSVTGTTINYSFAAINGSVTGYTVKLYNSAGTTVLQTSTPALSSSTIAGTFSSLTNSTTYKLELTVTADSFSKTCSQVSVTTNTSSASSCNAPTGVTSYLL
jgi:hypothetical protein